MTFPSPMFVSSSSTTIISAPVAREVIAVVNDGSLLFVLPRTQLDKLADVVAALYAGKLPSQEQVNRALRHALASDVLNSHLHGTNGGGSGEEELNEAGKEVLSLVRDALQAVLEFGMEKNDVAVEAAHEGNVDVDAIVQELPSQQEMTSDAAALVRSVYTLLYVLTTSAAFRLILSDILLVARETVADVAACVEVVAASVEKAAGDVGKTVRPGGGTIEDVKGKAAEASEKVSQEVSGEGILGQQLDELRQKTQQSPDELKAAVIHRLQEAVARAHSQPSFQSAIRTVLTLSRKYAAKVRVVASVASNAEAPTIEVTPLVWADPPLARALNDLKVFLQRVASGRSVDALLEALQVVVLDIVTGPVDALSESPNKTAMREWFSALARRAKPGSGRWEMVRKTGGHEEFPTKRGAVLP
ncbi:hypothetical protein L226DRAFT_563232 [Lentinus tigrinus ALCF2SS1-7]|uniref:uncharacterized protein n=1 Tax=Lentinus tigrinus ALCF2SS1-7 TaxID=1328758 RepID=UPI00116632EB|nr:hypothetical protein L226DRAFT_563232 [Lentinus tigrinus ALCF2SS1-7]